MRKIKEEKCYHRQAELRAIVIKTKTKTDGAKTDCHRVGTRVRGPTSCENKGVAGVNRLRIPTRQQKKEKRRLPRRGETGPRSKGH